MADESYLPGHILSLTAGAADRLITSGSGDAALLYLYLLKTAGEYQTAQAARALKWEPGRCDAAAALLAGLGLARLPETAPTPKEPEPPEYSAEDINRELESVSSPFPDLVREVQRRLGKPLSTSDLKSLYTIYDFSGLPPEVILLVVSWCVEEYQRKYGPGRMPRMPQIQREAIRWKERGAETAETAEAHLKQLTLLRDRSSQILALMDIRDRPAVTQEKDFIASWLNMGFPDEAIRLAYERTVVKTGKRSLPYMNRILTDWHNGGLHTAAEIDAAEGKKAPARRRLSGAGATAPQPAAPGEADRRARADMEQMRKLLRGEKGEGK